MKFSYTALTRENKKISGVLDVDNEAAAQAELHKMGVAIISVSQISEEDYEKLKVAQQEVKEKKGIKTFTFQAADPHGKGAEGTIDAVDAYAAFRRLNTEYQFTVSSLFLSTASEAEKQQALAQIAVFQQQLDAELAETRKKEGTEEISEEETEVNKEVMVEIDKVIINTKKALEKHRDLFSNDLILEIEKTLGSLELIRTSNNFRHITEVSNTLYTLISNPDKAEGDIQNESYQELVGQMADSALVRKEFDLYKHAIKFKGVKKVFTQIAQKLKGLTATEGKEAEAKGFSKFKASLHAKLEKLTKKKPPKLVKKEVKPKGKLGLFFDKLGLYLKATSPVLKKARQRELKAAFSKLFSKKSAEEAAVTQAKEGPAPAKKGKEAVEGKRDFTRFFVEIDSFIAWLLTFYVIYFFLVNFSLEKNIGLKPEFVFKTLKSPLILNISILLLVLHFSLRLKNLHFRQNAIAGLFLLFLSLGIYAVVIVNF